jgi:hypothetical protein
MPTANRSTPSQVYPKLQSQNHTGRLAIGDCWVHGRNPETLLSKSKTRKQDAPLECEGDSTMKDKSKIRQPKRLREDVVTTIATKNVK